MTPADLLSMMRGAIVTTGNLKNKKEAGKTEYVSVRPVADLKGKDAMGNPVPVYSISQADNPSLGFEAYICDYEQGKTKFAFLGQAADFMFTITMNGCTFGAGMPNANGEVLVCHSNTAKGFGSKTPPDLQAQLQRFQVEQLISQGGTILEPVNYRTVGKEQATTFGLRINNSWQFWMHTYLYSGNQTYTAGATTQLNGPQFDLAPAFPI